MSEKKERFIQLGSSMLFDPVIKKLSGNEFRLYVCMTMECGGYSEFTFSYSTAKKYGIARNTFDRARNKLIEYGLIERLNGEARCESATYRFLHERCKFVMFNAGESLAADDNEYIDYNAWGKIETLRDRDKKLEELWAEFGDVPMDPETECIEERFMGWVPGTNREEIWHWFDQRHSKGVAYLLYNDGFDRTPETAKLLYLKQFCLECESSDCQFNHEGECRFAMVHERKPRINDTDGCIDYDYCEGEGE